MAFSPVYYSQKDPTWAKDLLGSGTTDLAFHGCAVTSVAMLLKGYGYDETPQTLNRKLKEIQGFASRNLIIWSAVQQIRPAAKYITKKAGAPIDDINDSLRRGHPVIVQVDYDLNDPERNTHYVLVYGRKENDYLMLDPFYPNEKLLLAYYNKKKVPIDQVIHQAVFYELEPDRSSPVVEPDSEPGQVETELRARVKADATPFLRIRSSADRSSTTNIVARVSPGTVLTILEQGEVSKIGMMNQWVRVRTPNNIEGITVAQFLERVRDESSPQVEGEVEQRWAPRSKLFVQVQGNGTPVYKLDQGKGRILCTEKSGTKLAVLENAARAAAKIGKRGKWLNVRASNDKPGFIDAGLVKMAE
jgi:hypothetical protein